MSICTDNQRLGIIGCGATYNGRQQHSVARVDWSERQDGRAHLTFSTEGTADLCWRGETMHHPSTVATKAGAQKLRLDSRRVWRRAGERPERHRSARLLDATA